MEITIYVFKKINILEKQYKGFQKLTFRVKEDDSFSQIKEFIHDSFDELNKKANTQLEKAFALNCKYIIT